ncbi:MAG: prepilin-type N-terminal cleavage/methylation domain-containing protein [Armatimonadetes bacterium]|nr:prepilin-type N-terminal cleavage/methylation domain-containing protein [Armatimonadota bacterium]
MKRAFTLIELLVVIAIIAILAAILFPVFAQAKAAAKKTSSLSNVKQITLSAKIYQADFDDNFPLFLSGRYGNLSCPDPTRCADGLPVASQTWVGITAPYIKSIQMLVDPVVGDTQGNVVGPNAWYYTQNRRPMYGYNYIFLAPFYNCDTGLARNEGSSVKPADTVMFTESQGFTNASAGGFFGANPPGAWPIIAPAPTACIFWDGTKGSGNWAANVGTNPAVGAYSASVRATRNNPVGGSVVGFVDGHAKFMKPDALAIGTDYGSVVSTNGNDGAAITDLSKYLWTLDGTDADLRW